MKRDILLQILEIKKSHRKWYAYAEAIVNGIKTESDKFPQAYTDCIFGKWYYGAGQKLSFLQSFKEIEEIHRKLHTIYAEIYTEICNKKKFTKKFKLFKTDKKKKNIIYNNVKKLRRISGLLIEKIDDLEKAILLFPDDEFNKKTQ